VGDFAERHRPDLVLRVGDMPTSKPLREWVAAARQVVVDPHAAWHEPTRRAELILRCPAEAALRGLRAPRAEPGWLASWREADASVPTALAESPDGFEPKVLAALEPELPDGAVVWLSSSMPVRDVEACFPQSPKPLRFLANRGANGIDGVVSSAAGAALATGAPTWLLTGELALLHDIGGVLAARRAGADLHVVCLDNGGGGIFDFLPVAEHADSGLYERHIATPAGVDLEALFPEIRVVRTDRRENVRLHRDLVDRVAQAL
jgi:2-succinyl-5-enolpyruvyl-6-hydroxy-3-cyclohexene-1-carboxylate synthase